MVAIDGGELAMGCHPGDDACLDAERPARQVLVFTYKIDKTEATALHYLSCLEDGVCTPFDSDNCHWWGRDVGSLPQICLGWDQAEAYCAWAGKRLCSEAEWEWAAAGSEGRLFPWGDRWPDCQTAGMGAEVTGRSCEHDLDFPPVGSYPAGATPDGLLDMGGGAGEWVADCWHDTLLGGPTDGSVWSSECQNELFRVWKGGDINSPAAELRSSWRGRGFTPSGASGVIITTLGVRCCRDGGVP